MVLSEVAVDLVAAQDEARFRALMQAHHYLGALPGIGETLRHVAHYRGQWLALAVFSAPALKCGARDRWIGWSFGVQFDRLHLVTNNSRFLILPGAPRNLGSRVLALCMRRLGPRLACALRPSAAAGRNLRRSRALPTAPSTGPPTGSRSGAPAASAASAEATATANTRFPSGCSFIPYRGTRGPNCARTISTPRCDMECRR